MHKKERKIIFFVLATLILLLVQAGQTKQAQAATAYKVVSLTGEEASCTVGKITFERKKSFEPKKSYALYAIKNGKKNLLAKTSKGMISVDFMTDGGTAPIP